MATVNNFTGDLMITFQQSSPTVSRTEPYRLIVDYPDGSRLWTSPTIEHWKGSPLQSWTESGLTLWSVGETVTTQAGIADIQNWRGHFVLFGRDEERQQWHVWTNRLGTFHIYHGWDGLRGAVGTFAPAVAATVSRRKLDWEGLCGFFGFGFFPGDHTQYEDVKIIRPATHQVLDASGKIAREERTWEWTYRPDTRRSYPDTVTEFARIFETVLKDQAHAKDIALPISGGLDSRSTVAALTRVGQPALDGLHSYSYGYDAESIETRIAEKVARARNLPFSAYHISPYLFDQIENITACVEGFQDLTQCRQAAVIAELGESSGHVIAAHWGDVWLDAMVTARDASTATALELALGKVTKPGSELLIQMLQGYLVGENGQALLRRLVDTELGKYNAIEDPDFRIKVFKTEQWSFRWTLASLRAYQSHLFPLLPFYDPRLVDFFCTVPTEHLRARKLQIDYLKRFAPDLARIEWQPYRANLYLYPYFDTLLLPKRAIQKAARMLKGKVVIQRNWERQLLCESGRSGLNFWLLSPGRKILDMFPSIEIAALVDRLFARPERETGYAVSMLLTFSVWLEVYGG